MSKLKKIFPEMEEEEFEFVSNYKYKGLTPDEWMDEADKATGVDKDGNPKWMKKMANSQYAVVLARTIFLYKKEILNEK